MSATLILSTALLIKSSQSGHTPREWSYRLVCEIHADHVSTSRTIGQEVTVTEDKPISLQGDSPALIERARDEQITSQETPCDGPTDCAVAHCTRRKT